MWVFCCGMYRSASTLQFQITTRIVEEAQVGQRVGWIDAQRFAEVREAHAKVDGLKVVKVHQFTQPMGKEFEQGNALGIYSFRDIRDVYASMMLQQKKTFDEIWNWHGRNFIEGCLDNYHHWTNQPNVLVSQYDDVITNLPHEAHRIATHLGINLDAHQCQEIASGFTIQHQQERIGQFRDRLLQIALDPADHREIVDYHDEASLLHMNHINSAKTGRWKDDLSMSEVVSIETRVEDWCSAHHYHPSLFLQDVHSRVLN